MKYLLVLTTASLSVLKVSLQSSVAKRDTKTLTDSVFLTMLIFLCAAVPIFPFLFAASAQVWLYAVIYAMCNASFQISYTLALNRGNVSVAVMLANFGMLIPVIASCIAFGERPSAYRITGIVLMMAALAIMAKKSPNVKNSVKGLGFALFGMLANGAGLTVSKFFAKSDVGGENLSFVAASYALSAIICAAVYLLYFVRRQKRGTKLGKRFVLISAGVGASLAAFLTVNTYAAKVVDGSFHFPAHSILSTLLSMLSGVLLFHDRLSKRQLVAFIVGIAAVALINF